MRKILLVVQARMGSTRLPGKVMLEACGKSMLELMLERLGRVQRPVSIVTAVTTDPDDNPIASVCRRFGIDVFRGHPTDLLDRHYRAGLAFGAQAVVKIPSDCPLIDPSIVESVLDRFAAGDCDYASNLHPASYPDGNDVEIMSIEALEAAWREAELSMEREHTTPFIWERPERFRLANVIWDSDRGSAWPRNYALSHRWTLDYPEDYAFIRRIYEELYPLNPAFSIDDILALLKAKPELASINNAFLGVNWYRHHLHELKTVGAEDTRQI